MTWQIYFDMHMDGKLQEKVWFWIFLLACFGSQAIVKLYKDLLTDHLYSVTKHF